MAGLKTKNPRYFNPRSREGSDDKLLGGLVFFVDFNPRSREGSDQLKKDMQADIIISIHAPARGATRAYVDDVKLTHISIHAPARGATFCAPERNCGGE